MTYFQNYITYLEYLATQHKDIQHLPDIGQKAFDVASQDEVRDNSIFRTDLNTEGVIMRAVAYNFNIADSSDANGDVEKLGGFFILQRYSQTHSGSLGWVVIMDKMEKIGLEILERMTIDSKNKHPLFSRSADRIDAMRPNAIPKMGLGPDKNLFGFLFTFYFKPRLIMNTCVLSDRWNDTGVTDY